MSNKKILDCARKELEGFDLLYQGLLNKHNALEAVDVCCCDCAFCRDAHAVAGVEWWPVSDLAVCKACDELTQCPSYKTLSDRCEQLRRIIKGGCDE